MPKKCILILLDGLGDRSHESLNFMTPLQAAQTPVLDGLSRRGENGLYHATFPGQALPSETAHFLMFGYDISAFPGRGPLEALGAGKVLENNDVAVLAHFACLKNENQILSLKQGKPKITDKEVDSLIQSVAEYETNGIRICFNKTKGIYGILTLCGEVSSQITDTDPIFDGRPLSEIKSYASAKQAYLAQQTAMALKSYLVWAYQRLNIHPVNLSRSKKGLLTVNGIVTQRAGQLKKTDDFFKLYGLRGLSISSGIIYHGISAYIGLDCIKVADTDNSKADIAKRLEIARRALPDYDFIHVHTKTPDEAAHTKDPAAKKSVIELLDDGIGQAIGPLLEDPDLLIVVTADHSTPSAGQLIHSGEPVPLLFHGLGVRRDQVRHFSEVHAGGGSLSLLRGKELIYLILNHLDRSKLQGLMDTPLNQPFWPGDCEPFRLVRD